MKWLEELLAKPPVRAALHRVGQVLFAALAAVLFGAQPAVEAARQALFGW